VRTRVGVAMIFQSVEMSGFSPPFIRHTAASSSLRSFRARRGAVRWDAAAWSLRRQGRAPCEGATGGHEAAALPSPGLRRLSAEDARVPG
jgi:hypothetical protein